MRIEHLTKVYKSAGTSVLALDDVSFVLPDKGLVFVVGKSGSGKSTLLNMLGGLDEITSGDIIIGDKKFSEFSNSDFDDYRNSYLGFVFQDFCLIDELSVENNVRLALDLQGEHNADGKVADILEKVELKEFAHRKPSQLSGGQRQRVAIARALVKSPKLILADEPTGNLDSKTAVQALELLKKLSKDILVVIVSHNLSDAEKYADRIIELADGKILQDISRHDRGENTFEIDGNTVYIPDGVRMTDEQMSLLNDVASTGNALIVQRDTAFGKTENIADNEQNADFKHSKLSIKRTLGISRHFFKKKLISGALMAIMITAVVLLFALSRTFVRFDSNATMDEAMQKSDSQVLVMKKGVKDELLDTLNTQNIVKISQDEMDQLSALHDGKVYRKIPFSIPCSESNYATETSTNPSSEIYNMFYCKETTGVIICDEEYLTKIFGVDGSLTVYGDLYANNYPEGFIITDYIADSLSYFNKHNERDYTYEDFVGKELNLRGRVCAVVETGYKEKYADYLEKMKKREKISKEEAGEFVEYANTYLNVAYSFNENIVETFANSAICRLAKMNKVAFVTTKGEVYQHTNSLYAVCNTDEGRENECAMGVDLYNSIFGTTVSSMEDVEFQNNDNIVTINLFVKGESEIAYTRTFRVTALGDGTSLSFFDRKVAQEATKCNFFTSELYFDEPTSASAIYNLGEEMDMYVATEYFKTINSITKIVLIFRDIFSLIATALCGVMILLMASYSFGNIRSRSYEIGVMKAMGARTRNVAGIFLIQVIAMGFVICVLFGFLFYFGMPTANDVLMDSIVEYVNNASITSITLLSFDKSVMWSGIGIIAGVTLVSAIAPFVGVMSIKPVNIIKSKE